MAPLWDARQSRRPASASTLPTSTQSLPPRTGRYQYTVRDRRETPPPPRPRRGHEAKPRIGGPAGDAGGAPPPQSHPPRPKPSAVAAAVWMDRAACHVKSLRSHHPFHVAHAPHPSQPQAAKVHLDRRPLITDLLRLDSPASGPTWHTITDTDLERPIVGIAHHKHQQQKNYHKCGGLHAGGARGRADDAEPSEVKTSLRSSSS